MLWHIADWAGTVPAAGLAGLRQRTGPPGG
jgi:hypothetical protein